MDYSNLLTIVGAALSVLLSINAFLLSKLTLSINNVRVDLIRNITQHEATIMSVMENKTKIDVNVREIDSLRFKAHSLDGAIKQLSSYLTNTKNEH